MFGVLFVDFVCLLDFYKREKNFLLITNTVFFFKTSETFDFIFVRFQAPETFAFIVFNVALRFFIIALHLKSGVKTKWESSYIFLLVISTSFKQKNGEQQEHHF